MTTQAGDILIYNQEELYMSANYYSFLHIMKSWNYRLYLL